MCVWAGGAVESRNGILIRKGQSERIKEEKGIEKGTKRDEQKSWDRASRLERTGRQKGFSKTARIAIGVSHI